MICVCVSLIFAVSCREREGVWFCVCGSLSTCVSSISPCHVMQLCPLSLPGWIVVDTQVKLQWQPCVCVCVCLGCRAWLFKHSCPSHSLFTLLITKHRDAHFLHSHRRSTTGVQSWSSRATVPLVLQPALHFQPLIG